MKLTKTQIEQIPALCQTHTQNEVALRFKCSVRTIQYWITRWRKAGKKIKVQHGRPALKLTT